MEIFDYIQKYGPWVVLLLYYFLRLDRQMERVIELLMDIRQALRKE